MSSSKITVRTIRQKKGAQEKIAALTAYDYFTAKYLDEAGVDILLVGDSVEMVLYGSPTTLTADIAKMAYHTQAVSRGAKNALVVADLPFGTYSTLENAMHNAAILMRAGAAAVKFEGGKFFAPIVQALYENGIPVMAHIGMLPQSINKIGGYRTQGKTEHAAAILIEDAQALAQAGAFAVVLEKVCPQTAAQLTTTVDIPTIGIGSGGDCDGQILVINDILSTFDTFVPSFVKQYDDLKTRTIEAARNYVREVRAKNFPGDRT